MEILFCSKTFLISGQRLKDANFNIKNPQSILVDEGFDMECLESILYIKSEMHNIAIFNDVGFTFNA